LTETSTRKLPELKYGEEGLIKKIERDLRNQLVGRGIREGKKIRMDTKQPINGPVVITIDKSTTSLGFNLAKKISVEVKNDDTPDGSS